VVLADNRGSSVGQSGKLVRDRIPEIIRASGKEPLVRVADAEVFRDLLRDKLVEEVDEFLASDGDLEELADILEVVLALADDLGAGPAQLEEMRAAKAAERGGFSLRIVWSGNIPS
jgi:predicted house-cleaning noncanonical NTP pyrophosphatase (MazG superfamily)